ncbi:DUF2141 domain-containing protein [Flexithrix dorotheae]|uniref:DUF2141 domain-containing protein n=1 Tax=Flexithrix dorotheae TaxID=70993 RepID=UPI00037E5382|nr:DUF2141 domain-containing protein [Flexithrix dorotheae]
MKSLIFGILFLVSSGFSPVQINPGEHELQLVIKEIKQQSGKIMIAVYNEEDTYLDIMYKAISVPVDSNILKINISELPAGYYAISIFHDVNDNDELDKNFIGIPKEPFGFSNNVLGKFGPPSFANAKVKVGSGQEPVVIELR